jgi:hypothetical protein
MIGGNGQPVPLQGWSQSVLVQKMTPYDFSTAVDWTATQAAAPPFPGRTVDQYPLRVTVTVFYQGEFDAQAQAVTTMSWIVPAN